MAALSVACFVVGRTSTCFDPQDALPEGTPDPQVLKWAAAENRVLITNDRQTMLAFAYERVAAGEAVPGLIATIDEQSVGEAIDDILAIAEVTLYSAPCTIGRPSPTPEARAIVNNSYCVP